MNSAELIFFERNKPFFFLIIYVLVTISSQLSLKFRCFSKMSNKKWLKSCAHNLGNPISLSGKNSFFSGEQPPACCCF